MLVSVAAHARSLTGTARVALAATVALGLAASGIVAAAGGASADSSSSLVAMTNNARAEHGLAGFSVSGDLAAAARAQAGRMAASRTLAHTPNLTGAVCCWSTLGENVGEGPSASALQAAFMASPEHRANILSGSYTQVGIGVAVDASGTMWVSEIFRRPTGAVAAQPPAPKPVVTHAPAPVQRHTAAAKRLPAIAPPAAVNKPAAAVPTRASRDLARLPVKEAERLAKRLDTAAGVRGADPVSRLLDFVALNTTVGD